MTFDPPEASEENIIQVFADLYSKGAPQKIVVSKRIMDMIKKKSTRTDSFMGFNIKEE